MVIITKAKYDYTTSDRLYEIISKIMETLEKLDCEYRIDTDYEDESWD